MLPLLVVSTRISGTSSNPTKNRGAVFDIAMSLPLLCLSLSSLSFSFVLLLSVWINSGAHAPYVTLLIESW